MVTSLYSLTRVEIQTLQKLHKRLPQQKQVPKASIDNHENNQYLLSPIEQEKEQ